MPVDPGTIERAIGVIKKTYGESAMLRGNEKPDLRRISTGSLELDYAIGGGVPLGRWCHFFGPKSSGKTLTAYNVIAEAQRMGLTCAYYNAEKQYDEEWCQKHGIDTKALHLVEGTVIEEIGAKMHTLLSSVHVHVIDSLASAVAEDELAAKSNEWRPGIGARSWGKVIRRCNSQFDDAENTVIMINQTRAGMGYNAGEEPTQGKAVRYIARLELQFRRSSWLYHDPNGVLSPDAKASPSLSGDKEPDGIEFQARVVKTAGFGKQDRTARMRLDYDTGQYDDLWTLCKSAVHLGLVEQKGGWFQYGEKKVQGRDTGLRELVAGDKKLQETIKTKLMEAA